MADYLVRVELFDASNADYERLHEKMKNIGFNRYVHFNDGTAHHLPTGSYIGDKSGPSESIRDSVSSLANPLSTKPAAVFVCKYSDWSAYLYPGT
jgi:hypothetical protein